MRKGLIGQKSRNPSGHGNSGKSIARKCFGFGGSTRKTGTDSACCRAERTDDKVQQFLKTHALSVHELRGDYSETPKHA